jgi:hypothetical protein
MLAAARDPRKRATGSGTLSFTDETASIFVDFVLSWRPQSK